MDDYHPLHPEAPVSSLQAAEARRAQQNRERLLRLAAMYPNLDLPTRLRLHRNDPHCHYCRRELTYEDSTVDHKVPRSKGGTLHPDNVLLACKLCNNAKGDMDYDAFVALFVEHEGRLYFMHPNYVRKDSAFLHSEQVQPLKPKRKRRKPYNPPPANPNWFSDRLREAGLNATHEAADQETQAPEADRPATGDR